MKFELHLILKFSCFSNQSNNETFFFVKMVYIVNLWDLVIDGTCTLRLETCMDASGWGYGQFLGPYDHSNDHLSFHKWQGIFLTTKVTINFSRKDICMKCVMILLFSNCFLPERKENILPGWSKPAKVICKQAGYPWIQVSKTWSLDECLFFLIYIFESIILSYQYLSHIKNFSSKCIRLK